ncbi:hypothetical protein HK405_001162, partial [Cladochytrium tenue]
MGLDVQDLTAVENYAAKLRSGDKPTSEKGIANRPTLNNEQLEKLAIELERVHVEAAEAREKIDRLEEERRKVGDENRALEAVVKELSTALIALRGKDGDSADDSSRPSFPVIRKMLGMLEKKRISEVKRDMASNESVEDHLLEVNRSMRDELISTRRRLEEAEAELEETHKEAERSKKDNEVLRLRAAKARGKVLELPAELLLGSVHDYSAVVEQLVECLLELQVKDRELKDCRVALERFNHYYALSAAKQRMLYKDHQAHKQAAEDNLRAANRATAEALAAKEAAEIHAEGAEKLARTLAEGQHGDLRIALTECQRQVTVLRVNEAVLKRRQLAMADLEAICRKENAKLQDDILKLETKSRETIGGLHRTKKELRARVDELLGILSDTVPYRDYSAVRNSLELYKAKTKLLLEREQEWIADKVHANVHRSRIEELEARVESLQSELIESDKKVVGIESVLTEVKSSSGPGSLKEKLAGALHKMSQMEVTEEMLRRRAILAEEKCKSLEVNEQKLKAQLDEVERKCVEVSEDNIKLKEIEVELRNEFEGGVNRQEHEKVLAKKRELADRIAKLEDDIVKYKETAEIAAKQSTDLLHLHSSDEKEKAILRAAIQELQLEGDEKLLIGKLHHHILAIQMSEATALRKLEDAERKCLGLEAQIAQSEKYAADFDRAIFNLRTEHRSSIRLLYQTVSGLRCRLAGAVMLDKHERACDIVRRLEQGRKSQSETIKALREEKIDLQSELAACEEKLQAQSELVNSLREPTAAMERISSWQTRMAALQVENIRVLRRLEASSQDRQSLERNLETQTEKAAALEEQLLEMQADSDVKQMEWERRQMELEMTVQRLQEEREEIVRAASTAEAALRMLVERSRLLSAQEHKISSLEAQIASMVRDAETWDETLHNKDTYISELKTKMTKLELVPGLGLSEEDNIARSLARAREGEAMRSGQEIIRSLQRQLSKKDELIDRYRDMIARNRREVAERDEARLVCAGIVEKANLTEVINALNDQHIERLRNPPEVPQQLIANREGWLQQDEVVGLQERLEDSETKLLHLHSQMEEKLDELQAKLDSKQERLERSEEEIERLQKDAQSYRDEIRLAEEAAAESQKARGLQETVGKLRRELEKKEAKIAGMRKALEEMKDAMVKNAEEKDKELKAAREKFLDAQKETEELKIRVKKLLTDQGLKVSERSGRIQDAQRRVPDSGQADLIHSLSMQTKAHEEAARKEEVLKQAVERLERERNKLQQKVAALSALPELAEAAVREQLRTAPVTGQRVNSRARARSPSGGRLDTTDEAEHSSAPMPDASALARLAAGDDPDATPLEIRLARELLLCAADRDEVQRRRHEAELDAEAWRRTAEVERASEIESLRARCVQLTEQLDEAAAVTGRLRDTVGGGSSPDRGARRGERTTGLAAVLEARVQDLLARVHASENEKLEVEGRLAEVRFDYEKAVAGAERLARRAKELEETLRCIRETDGEWRARRAAGAVPGLNVTVGQLRTSAARLLACKTPAEVAGVVDGLSQLAERLQKENESLKRTGGVSSSRYMDLVREVKALRQDKMDAQQTAKARAAADAQLAKVESENAKLRRQLRRESERADREMRRSQELGVAREGLQDEVSRLRRALSGIAADPAEDDGRGSPAHTSSSPPPPQPPSSSSSFVRAPRGVVRFADDDHGRDDERVTGGGEDGALGAGSRRGTVGDSGGEANSWAHRRSSGGGSGSADGQGRSFDEQQSRRGSGSTAAGSTAYEVAMMRRELEMWQARSSQEDMLRDRSPTRGGAAGGLAGVGGVSSPAATGRRRGKERASVSLTEDEDEDEGAG